VRLRRREFLGYSAAFLAACSNQAKSHEAAHEIYDAFSNEIFKYLDKTAGYEVLGQGYGWSEGPAWDKKRSQLYFTDVPGNIAYSWSEASGVEVFLEPSGAAVTKGFREPGANGLIYTESGDLVLCNHGERTVQRLDPHTKKRETIVDNFEGKKFNSPNDVILGNKETIYFTDPPYGLEGMNDSLLKELSFNGVYRLQKGGTPEALIKDMTFPNGVALSPDQKTLYITQSDPEAAHLYSLDLTEPGATKQLMVDFSQYINEGLPGLPDGMVVDMHGNIFVTGPGGVYVVTDKGEVLGRINTGKGSANCTFGEDGSTLFITNHDRLLKLKTKTRGLSWKS